MDRHRSTDLAPGRRGAHGRRSDPRVARAAAGWPYRQRTPPRRRVTGGRRPLPPRAAGSDGRGSMRTLHPVEAWPRPVSRRLGVVGGGLAVAVAAVVPRE
jgi:hypothetical protein